MNEDIIIALKNGVERGEDLQSTMQILVNSGYNPAEVEEASKYVQSGVMPTLETKPDEELLMPEQKKGIFSRTSQTPQVVQAQQNANQVQQGVGQVPQGMGQVQQNVGQVQQNMGQVQQGVGQVQQGVNQIPQNVNQAQQIKPEIAPEQGAVAQQLPAQVAPIKKPKKELWIKEIALFVILLILIGVLVALVFFKDKFLTFFS